MAATDQFYRNQKKLNVVFAVSCVLTLLVTIWMLYDDYNKPYKAVQREFRDVETLVTERTMLARLPEPSEVKARLKKVEEARKNLREAEAKVDADRRTLQVERDVATAEYQRIKADLDSIASYHDLEAEKLGHAKGSEKEDVQKKVEAYKLQINDLTTKLSAQQNVLTGIDTRYNQSVGSVIEKPQRELAAAQDELKKLTDSFTRLAKVTAEKRWKMGDSFRDLPIIDGFAPPTKIHQITLNDLPIDYGGFKDVTRYDRCMTCHLGIERSNYTRETLASLSREPDLEKLRASYRLLRSIQDAGESLGFDLEDINPDKMLQVKPLDLTAGQVTMYATHPRLDLFVDSNSPHSAEKFGCTACHGGQGSATDFNLASHTPNDALQMQRWMGAQSSKNPDGYHWHSNHYWDFPMMPKRFTEATCLKCHHQVTDLVREGTKEEAPKLTEGYELVRDNGCFGCHEIAGQKGGRSVGPDLRLEPTPALDWLSPAEQAKAKADSQNPVGTFRKVGPGLRRLHEKTTDDWVSRWIKTPRGFREDTKMPHFYGLSTNAPEVLPDDQKPFPDAEIYAITQYLMGESKLYLEGKDSTREVVAAQVQRLEKVLTTTGLTVRERKDLMAWTKRYGDLLLLASPSEGSRINVLLAEQQRYQDELSELQSNKALQQQRNDKDAVAARTAEIKEKADKLTEISKELQALKPVSVLTQLVESNGAKLTGALPPRVDDPAKLLAGRKLFTEKGCMACHSHDATGNPGTSPEMRLPAIVSEANYGPNLTRIAEKIGNKQVEGRRWLTQWLLNPNVHSPRTRMPVTHLSVAEAASIADWLLSLKVKDWSIDPSDQPQAGVDTWSKVKVDKPDLVTLQKLATLYIKGTAIGKTDASDVAVGGLKETHKARLTNPDADEWLLDGPAAQHEQNLIRYIGKKAIGRLGCYGCHDIPGFETAKPIGTPLNDWGKKDPTRLAFEDAGNFVKAKYHIVELRDDEKNPNKPNKDWKVDPKTGKKPYEKYFAEAVESHSRDGFLQLKLADPRSYDYERIRSWEDRLRMPQFRFARTRKQKSEDQAKYDLRREFTEAKSREAVMTFVLGLVAEPIPMKYVYQPKKERLDEIKGRHVLEKYNCSACHHLAPGSIEYSPGRNQEAREELIGRLNDKLKPDSKDYVFPSSNAWSPNKTLPNIMAAHAAIIAPVKDERTSKGERAYDEKVLRVLLSEAMGFQSEDGENRAVRAGEEIQVNKAFILRRTAPYGGTWTNLMDAWLDDLQFENAKATTPLASAVDKYKGEPERFGSLPPPLLREGERVQSQWLYQFLLNPQPIRPTTVLRMPRFNMSEEEARLLTNYFNSTARANNPGIGVSESYVEVQQKDPRFWGARSTRYFQSLDEQSRKQRLDSLAPIWEAYLKDEIKEKERALTRAEEEVKAAPADKKEALEKNRDALKAERDTLMTRLSKKDFATLNADWEAQDAYAVDAYRLLKDPASACITCHSIGNMKIQGERGPNLAMAAERLRPEWTLQWIANPARMMSYTPVMPMNFPPDADLKTREGVMKAFHTPGGKQPVDKRGQFERVEALRDVLFDLPRVSNLPVIRYSEK